MIFVPDSIRIALFIPTFNVEEQIPDVLKKLTPKILSPFSKVYIIDNGSQDQTINIALKWAKTVKNIDISIFQNQKNQFLGGSTCLAFEKSFDDNIDYLICMHSDGQASPSDLGKFVSYINKGDVDFLLGSRFVAGANHESYSKFRYLFNLIFSYLQQSLIKKKVYDLGAFIGFKMSTIKHMPYRDLPFDMGYHPYLILLACRLRKNIHFVEFPISWGRVEVTNINVFKYGLIHLGRIAKLHFNIYPKKKKQDVIDAIQIY